MRALFFALFAATSFSLAAENVWTLGEYDKRLGWALISGDGKVTLRLEGVIIEDEKSEGIVVFRRFFDGADITLCGFFMCA